jgi:hypothetical protein
MTPSGPNRLVYVFPAVALAAVALYYAYGAVDQLGLETRQADVVVTGRQVVQGSTTYNTTIAGGRAWTQSTENPDAHMVAFEIDGEATGGAVDPAAYESLREGDRVHVQFQRTRLSRRLVVTDVRR